LQGFFFCDDSARIPELQGSCETCRERADRPVTSEAVKDLALLLIELLLRQETLISQVAQVANQLDGILPDQAFPPFPFASTSVVRAREDDLASTTQVFERSLDGLYSRQNLPEIATPEGRPAPLHRHLLSFDAKRFWVAETSDGIVGLGIRRPSDRQAAQRLAECALVSVNGSVACASPVHDKEAQP